MVTKTEGRQLVRFEEVGSKDVATVGGKNANLGEMIRELKGKGIPVPDGFATTAKAYRDFLEANNLADRIESQLADYRNKRKELHEIGEAIRGMFLEAEFPDDLS